MHHIKAWLRSKRQDKSSGAAHRSVPDDEKRQVEAACQEFAGSGYAAISVETVARGAGNSTKTQYRLIPNKAAFRAGAQSQFFGAAGAGAQIRSHPERTGICEA
jgi:AcrR family transcriptional regulator